MFLSRHQVEIVSEIEVEFGFHHVTVSVQHRLSLVTSLCHIWCEVLRCRNTLTLLLPYSLILWVTQQTEALVKLSVSASNVSYLSHSVHHSTDNVRCQNYYWHCWPLIQQHSLLFLVVEHSACDFPILVLYTFGVFFRLIQQPHTCYSYTVDVLCDKLKAKLSAGSVVQLACVSVIVSNECIVGLCLFVAVSVGQVYEAGCSVSWRRHHRHQ